MTAAGAGCASIVAAIGLACGAASAGSGEAVSAAGAAALRSGPPVSMAFSAPILPDWLHT
jgi:hypothetical protein